jgi:hypothetical protein
MKMRNWVRHWAVLAAIGVFVFPTLASAASDGGTLTVGTLTNTFNGRCITVWHGYFSGAVGSYSPTGLTGGGNSSRRDRFAKLRRH